MTRGRISGVRALMLLLIFFGIYFLSTKYSELTLIGFIVSMIVCTVFWIGAEIDWKKSEDNSSSNYILKNKKTEYSKSPNSYIGQAIILIAAICTIIGYILIFIKEFR